MNSMYNRAKYIYWAKEAIRETVSQEDMKNIIKDISCHRKPVNDKTLRSAFTNDTYKIDQHGDYYSLYFYSNGNYYIISSNAKDNSKNLNKNREIRADQLFNKKFTELNGISLRKAFGFMNSTLKRCIPKQFYYLNKAFVNKEFIGSSIDASSQYPSGCLGRLPDAHTAILMKGKIKPNEEYPFAFYASGHCAEYNVFDTHDWLLSKYVYNLFRFDDKEEWPFRPLKDNEEETILMKPSKYTMDSTWNYFYNIKQSYNHNSPDYNTAKLIMNKTIGCWHRKDKDKKSFMTYEDHGSYQLAHIVAIAIGRGNQKILNKVKEIGEVRVGHICVDGIIYAGSDIQGISESKLGIFAQEFTGAKIKIKDINVYAAEIYDTPIKFKHGSFDLIYGELIDDKLYNIKDLDYLSRQETLREVIEEYEEMD